MSATISQQNLNLSKYSLRFQNMDYTNNKIQQQRMKEKGWEEIEEILEAHYRIISDRKLNLPQDEELDKQDKQITQKLIQYIKEKKSSRK